MHTYFPGFQKEVDKYMEEVTYYWFAIIGQWEWNICIIAILLNICLDDFKIMYITAPRS